jgi:hypothetical protein
VGRRRVIVSRRRPTPGAGGEDPPPAPPVGSEQGDPRRVRWLQVRPAGDPQHARTFTFIR